MKCTCYIHYKFLIKLAIIQDHLRRARYSYAQNSNGSFIVDAR